MTESFLISKLPAHKVQQALLFVKLEHDEKLSRLVNMSVFWYDAVITPDKLDGLEAVTFTLDEVLVMGIQGCANYVDFGSYLSKKGRV